MDLRGWASGKHMKGIGKGWKRDGKGQGISMGKACERLGCRGWQRKRDEEGNTALIFRVLVDLRDEQSHERYMVSGSLCPLVSFLDVSYSVSFVVRQRPSRG